MDYGGFVTAVERGTLPPVVLVHGADPQLLDDALAIVTRALLPDASLVPLGREVVAGKEVTADEVVRSAMTLPLMMATRLVVVRHAQDFPAMAQAAIAAYAKAPNPSTCLLLLADESLEANRDRKRHWLLEVVPSAGVVTLPSRERRSLGGWLRQRAAAEGLTVSDEAARLLVDWVGDDSAALLGEARKAALAAVGANRQVGVREVEAVVGEHRVADVFELMRAIEKGETGLALRTLDRLLGTEEPMRLIALLASDLRMTWTVQEFLARGQSADQIARAIRRSTGFVHARANAARRLSAATLATRLRRCWDVEWRLKSGGEERAELAALVTELSSEGG